jgi:hypothetical protein
MSGDVGVFDIEPLIERITNAQIFKGVEESADLDAALQAGSPRTPWAFVVVANQQSPSPIGTSEYQTQKLDTVVNVVVAARNYRRADRNPRISDDLKGLLIPLRQLLLGWAPAEGYNGFGLIGGKLEKYTNATAWWIEAYITDYYTQVQPQP